MAETKSPATGTAAKVEETKRQRFERLATARTAKARDAIAALRGLTAKGNYDYTPAHWKAIFGELETEMTTLQSAVAGTVTAEPSKSLFAGIEEGDATPAT